MALFLILVEWYLRDYPAYIGEGRHHFLGIVSYHRFMKIFSKMTQPLHTLIHKGATLFLGVKSAFECFSNAELPEIIEICEETQCKLLYMIVLTLLMTCR